ncbi:MAG: T9SS type A sorting domain-containing protein [Bacteroidetes bacterium]|nr:T9SS type A sorting domain-containing protein [Bacteroidota bacterium]
MNRKQIFNFVFICLFAFCSKLANAQKSKYYLAETDPPVLKTANGDSKNGFFGGLRYPRFNSIDLDFDGNEDLVIFDREGQQLLTFLGNGNAINPQYTFAPDYADYFNVPLQHFVILADYNCDGKKDIFTIQNNYFVLHENVSENKTLRFKRRKYAYPDTFGFHYFDPSFDFLLNMSPSTTDVPAIFDYDGDGDLDIFCFDNDDNKVTFFRNMGIERFNSCDSMRFEVETHCWGRFSEGSDNEVYHLDKCNLDGEFKRAGQHTGSNLLILDNDGDGDYDMLLSDISYPDVILLENGKKDNNERRDSMMKFVHDFPSSKPIDIDIFPALYYLDMDFDGVKDLIAAPGPSSDEGYSVNQQWFFKNKGKNNNPTFNYVQNDYLFDQTIDLGTNSYPAFFDEDGDGDMDLIVSAPKADTNGRDAYYRLALYENIGSKNQAKFQLKNDNYLDLFARKENHAAPAFGDVDNNGTIDLLIGVSTDKYGKLLFYENAKQPNQTASFSFKDAKYAGIESTRSLAPYLYDIDADNKTDLFIGTDTGFVDFWQMDNGNNWTLKTNEFGKAQVSLWDGRNNIGGYARPVIADIDNDEKPEMLVGNDYGEVVFFDNISATQTTFSKRKNFVYNSLKKDTLNKRFGSYSNLAIADLNNDSLFDVVVGNERGGLHYLKGLGNPFISVPQIEATRNFELFPNPTNGISILRTDNYDYAKGSLQVLNNLGQIVHSANQIGHNYQLETANWPKGLYQIVATSAHGKTASLTLVVQ